MMTTMAPTTYEIEVRTWPERSDVLVIDVDRAIVLAHYELDEEGPKTPLSDPLAPYSDRAAQAIAALHSDQPYLQAHFRSGEQEVELRDVDASRSRLSDLLAQHDLTLADVELANLPQLDGKMDGMDIGDLFSLLVDWHDVVERHYPQGSSYQESESWVHRARPENAFHFHYLAAGVEDRNEASEQETSSAYELFHRFVDVDLPSYSFGFYLRWVYFHRTEFPDVSRPRPRAWDEAGI